MIESLVIARKKKKKEEQRGGEGEGKGKGKRKRKGKKEKNKKEIWIPNTYLLPASNKLAMDPKIDMKKKTTETKVTPSIEWGIRQKVG